MVLKNDKNCALISDVVALGFLYEKVMYHVKALFLKALENCAIFRSSSVTWFDSQVDS